MFLKRLKAAGVLLSLVVISACGDGGSGGAVIKTTQTGTAALTATQSGATAANGSVALDGALLFVPAGTTLKAADGSPVTGASMVVMTYGTTSSTFSAEEQTTMPADSDLLAYVDITITGDKKVKTVSPPIPVSFKVPLADGETVDLYSNGGAPGDKWVSEGTATVAGGKVSFTVSHFSKHSAHKKKPKHTGGQGGNNGNGGTTTN